VLREIKSVQQERGVGRRRWFESEGLDLVVWLDAASGEVAGFQLCYDLGAGEHALTWRTDEGFSHTRVDSGDDVRPYKGSPVLEPDGSVPWVEIAALFEARSETLEAPLRKLIRDRLEERTKAKETR
jgi:hypothetical protein